MQNAVMQELERKQTVERNNGHLVLIKLRMAEKTQFLASAGTARCYVLPRFTYSARRLKDPSF